MTTDSPSTSKTGFNVYIWCLVLNYLLIIQDQAPNVIAPVSSLAANESRQTPIRIKLRAVPPSAGEPWNQVMTVGSVLPVSGTRLEISREILMSSDKASCASIPCFEGSASKDSR